MHINLIFKFFLRKGLNIKNQTRWMLSNAHGQKKKKVCGPKICGPRCRAYVGGTSLAGHHLRRGRWVLTTRRTEGHRRGCTAHDRLMLAGPSQSRSRKPIATTHLLINTRYMLQLSGRNSRPTRGRAPLELGDHFRDPSGTRMDPSVSVTHCWSESMRWAYVRGTAHTRQCDRPFRYVVLDGPFKIPLGALAWVGLGCD